MQATTRFSINGFTIDRIVTGQIQENTYILSQGNAAVIIDPGDEAPRLIDHITKNNLKPEAILLTHAHFDHVGAVQELRLQLELPVCLHKDAWPQLTRAKESAARWNMALQQPEPPDYEILPGEFKLELSQLTLQALFTPGHAPGHVAFHHKAGFVISGDALFKDSIGRTDLPGADHALLLESIARELLTLPSDTIVFPGHGIETSIGREAMHNPFLV